MIGVHISFVLLHFDLRSIYRSFGAPQRHLSIPMVTSCTKGSIKYVPEERYVCPMSAYFELSSNAMRHDSPVRIRTTWPLCVLQFAPLNCHHGGPACGLGSIARALKNSTKVSEIGRESDPSRETRRCANLLLRKFFQQQLSIINS